MRSIRIWMTDDVTQDRNMRVELPDRHCVLTAVDHASLEAAAGEIVGIVGESGTGKSTTGNAVMGLLAAPGRLSSGKVLLNGNVITALAHEGMQKLRCGRIGMIFQIR